MFVVGRRLAKQRPAALLRAAACEAHATSRRELRAFAGRSCGPPTSTRSKPFGSRLRPSGETCDERATHIRAAACEAHATSRRELRAFAGRSCGPPTSTRSKPFGSRLRPSGETCDERATHIRAAACEAHATSRRELRAFAGRSCGPPTSTRSKPFGSRLRPSGETCDERATHIRAAACEAHAMSLVRIAGLRAAKLRPAALSREPAAKRRSPKGAAANGTHYMRFTISPARNRACRSSRYRCSRRTRSLVCCTSFTHSSPVNPAGSSVCSLRR